MANVPTTEPGFRGAPFKALRCSLHLEPNDVAALASVILGRPVTSEHVRTWERPKSWIVPSDDVVGMLRDLDEAVDALADRLAGDLANGQRVLVWPSVGHSSWEALRLWEHGFVGDLRDAINQQQTTPLVRAAVLRAIDGARYEGIELDVIYEEAVGVTEHAQRQGA